MASSSKKHVFLLLLALIAAQFVFLLVTAADASRTLTVKRPAETKLSRSPLPSGKAFRSHERQIDLSSPASAPYHGETGSSRPSIVIKAQGNDCGIWSPFIVPPAHVASWKPQGGIRSQLRDRPVAPVEYGKSLSGGVHRSVPIRSEEVQNNSSLRATIGISPTPLVLLTQFLARSTLTDKIVYLLFVLCYSLCIFNWLLKNHPDI
jgi:hypothetical protein